MMDRRNFMAMAGGAAALAPFIARAQSPRAAGKIGFLHQSSIAPSVATLTVLRPAWRELGYVEGETVLLRSADGDLTRLPGLVAELIGLGVGVLMPVGAAAVKAASQATGTLPIVAIDLETDPVRAGYAASLARPGGNVTGLFMDLSSLAGKWIELLREAVPTIERVALVWDPSTGPDQLESGRAAARTLGIEVEVVELGTPEANEETARRMASWPRTGIVHLTAPGGPDRFRWLFMAAQRHRHPTITFFKNHAMAGALLSYGPNQEAYFGRAAVMADKILKGARAGDMPIERPSKFELVINLKTAQALGLTIPDSFFSLVDEVIQ